MNKRVGYKEQGKSRASNQKGVEGVKPGFAINHEQMEFERRKLMEAAERAKEEAVKAEVAAALAA